MFKNLLMAVVLAGLCITVVLILKKYTWGPKQEAPPSKTAENFKLLDHEGKLHELYYYSDMRAVVLISQGNACPIFRNSIPRIKELRDMYQEQGVVFLLINANSQDDRDDLIQEASDYSIDMPILKDEAQIIVESLDIYRTAEALLIDPLDWRIVYQGAIDDRLGYETRKRAATHDYLQDALEMLLAGGQVSSKTRDATVFRTEAKGCLIRFEQPREDVRSQVSYTQDIVPILQSKCLLCHQQGGSAPWAMTDYETIRGWTPMIREVVRTRRMPPWWSDPYYGEYKYNFSLTPEETRTLVHWIEAGAFRSEGPDPLPNIKPNDELASLLHKGEWPLGKPDLIFTVPRQDIPATGVVDYVYIEAEQTIPEDIWVRAMHHRPSNLKAVHHAHSFLKDPEDTAPLSSAWVWENPDADDMFLSAYVPGFYGVSFYPEGIGKFLRKGSRLVFQIHYIATGKPESDRTELALYLAGKKPSERMVVNIIYNTDFVIPPGVKEHEVTARRKFDQEITLHALGAHMHYRGKWAKFTAQYPDRTEEVLLSVPEYDFNWQAVYTFAEPKKLPAGTVVFYKGAFDNSTQNPANPDPGQEIRFGAQSYDEMFLGYVVRSESVENIQ